MTERDLPQGIKAPPLQPIQPNFTVGDNMTTLDELLSQKRHFETVITGLENKDRLGHEGLDALWKARNDLWDVERQITEKECGE